MEGVWCIGSEFIVPAKSDRVHLYNDKPYKEICKLRLNQFASIFVGLVAEDYGYLFNEFLFWTQCYALRLLRDNIYRLKWKSWYSGFTHFNHPIPVSLRKISNFRSHQSTLMHVLIYYCSVTIRRCSQRKTAAEIKDSIPASKPSARI